MLPRLPAPVHILLHSAVDPVVSGSGSRAEMAGVQVLGLPLRASDPMASFLACLGLSFLVWRVERVGVSSSL